MNSAFLISSRTNGRCHLSPWVSHRVCRSKHFRFEEVHLATLSADGLCRWSSRERRIFFSIDACHLVYNSRRVQHHLSDRSIHSTFRSTILIDTETYLDQSLNETNSICLDPLVDQLRPLTTKHPSILIPQSHYLPGSPTCNPNNTQDGTIPRKRQSALPQPRPNQTTLRSHHSSQSRPNTSPMEWHRLESRYLKWQGRVRFSPLCS